MINPNPLALTTPHKPWFSNVGPVEVSENGRCQNYCDNHENHEKKHMVSGIHSLASLANLHLHLFGNQSKWLVLLFFQQMGVLKSP
jgi:hypothetical protein